MKQKRMNARVLTFVLAQTFAGLLAAQNLTLKVQGLEHKGGHLYVALYNNEADFLKKPATGFRVEVTDTLMILPCKGLPKGSYAVSLFHDENGNGKLDTGTYGIPTEKYGFSGNAQVVMGPPPYEKCRFELSQDTTLVIRVQ